jgi:adenosylhomocysteinase
MIHEGERAENDPAMLEKVRHQGVYCMIDRIRAGLAKDKHYWSKLAANIRGVSEETTTGVHRLYLLAREGRHPVSGHQFQRFGDQVQV